MAFQFGRGNQQLGEYAVDVVFCIDASGSMGPVIETVKNNALTFSKQFKDALDAAQKTVSEVRVRVIVFRDNDFTGNDFETSDAVQGTEDGFFVLDDQAQEFRSYVSSIGLDGGIEPGFEAIATAMKSKWTDHGSRRRHIIVVFTDEDAYNAAKDGRTPNYPKGMPKDLTEMSEWWHGRVPGGNLGASERRMILFAPDAWPYNIMATWDLVEHVVCNGAGCKEADMENILAQLVKSFSTISNQ